MGFPENVLTHDERVERDLHPHWQVVVPATIVGVILTAGAIYIAYRTPDDSTGNWIQWITVAVAVLLGIPLVIVPFMRWRTTRYVITTHRVMLRQGIVNKSGKDITLSKITDVSYDRRILDRLVGSGTLSIESAGDSPNELFRAIPHSDRVQQLINRLIDEDANKRAMRMVARSTGDDTPSADTEAPTTKITPTTAHAPHELEDPRTERPDPSAGETGRVGEDPEGRR
ncbi:MAG: PH domain-containing protein [Actinomycetota bacterium]|nr:PH domain-containing protein [Actinomycetota bacterium]